MEKVNLKKYILRISLIFILLISAFLCIYTVRNYKSNNTMTQNNQFKREGNISNNDVNNMPNGQNSPQDIPSSNGNQTNSSGNTTDSNGTVQSNQNGIQLHEMGTDNQIKMEVWLHQMEINSLDKMEIDNQDKMEICKEEIQILNMFLHLLYTQEYF